MEKNSGGLRRFTIIGSLGRFGTKVIDMDTGEEVQNIGKITWIHAAGELPQCTIELVNVTCEAEVANVDVKKRST